jgi:hypothetical protein
MNENEYEYWIMKTELKCVTLLLLSTIIRDGLYFLYQLLHSWHVIGAITYRRHFVMCSQIPMTQVSPPLIQVVAKEKLARIAYLFIHLTL